MKEVASSVEAIEAEAEKILGDARAKVSEILLKAKDESGKILASEMPMEEVKKEYDKIIRETREEADKKIAEAEKKASEIRAGASDKVAATTARIVSIITGAKLG